MLKLRNNVRWVHQASATACMLVLVACAGPAVRDRNLETLARLTAAREDGISPETVADSTHTRAPLLESSEPLFLDRNTALAIASRSSRNLQNRRDELYRAGISFFGARRDFEPVLSGTAEYVFSGGDEAPDRRAGQVTLGVTQILPTGGRVSAAVTQSMADEDGRDPSGTSYGSNALIGLEQPLFAGAGPDVVYEPLVQAERDYVYALRRFALERQDFAISILREYYNLLGQRKVVENTRTNYQQFIFLRQRSEALFQVNRAPAIDVLRSQQEELSALNRLTTTEEAYRIQIGRFMILLGQPSWVEPALADDIPVMRHVDLDEPEALRLALAHRMDVQTARDQVEDARRKAALARNQALPEVNVFGSALWQGEERERVAAGPHDQEWRAGVRADLPLDRRAERDAVRLAALDIGAAERRLEEREESTRIDVRESFSRLRALTVSVDIQLRNIEIAEKRAANALLQFRNGRLSNRDVVEAANGLLDARNAYVNALADYEIQRLNLLRQVGLLDISPDGVIIERTPGT